MEDKIFLTECAIIGGLGLFPYECEDALNKLHEDDFTNEKVKKLFKLFRDTYKKDGKYDFAIVAAKITDSDLREILMNAMEMFTVTANYPYYINAVKKNGRNHRLLNKISCLPYQSHDDLFSELNSILRTEESYAGNAETYSMSNTIQKVKEGLRNNDVKDRIYTGWGKLDKITGGLQKKMISVIGAFPSTGKTTFMLNICERQAEKEKKSIFFSLEMSAEQLMQKMAASLTGINFNKIRDKKLTEEELNVIDYELDFLCKERYFYVFDDIYTIEGICEKIAEYKPDFVVIDYLQVVRSTEKHENEKSEVRYIMQELKRIAKKYNSHIAIASQFIRTERSSTANAGKTKTREPTMFDLYGGSAIEQAGDYISILSRPCVTDLSVDQAVTQFVIAKNKLGRIGKFDLRFDGDRQRFISIEGNL